MPTATCNADAPVCIDPTGTWEPGETRDITDDHAAVLARSHLFTVTGFDGDPRDRGRAQGTPESAAPVTAPPVVADASEEPAEVATDADTPTATGSGDETPVSSAPAVSSGRRKSSKPAA